VTAGRSGTAHSYLDEPWDFSREPDEATIYRQALETLMKDRYLSALEIGCCIPDQTPSVAEHCDHLLVIDRSNPAIEEAKLRYRSLENVQFARQSVPYEYPHGCFDLTILSVGDYLTPQDLATLAAQIEDHTAQDGELLLSQGRTRSSERPLTGDQVHDFFLARQDWMRLAGTVRRQYRTDLFAKAGQRP